jgi:hypothetical protein
MSNDNVKKLVSKEEVETAVNNIFSQSGLELVMKTRRQLTQVLIQWSEYVNDVFMYCFNKRQNLSKEETACLKDECSRYFETTILELINKEDST